MRDRHYDVVAAELDPGSRIDRLCELNVIEQVRNVCQTSIVEEAWGRGQPVAVHGWIYGLDNGRLRDLRVTVASRAALGPIYQSAIDALRAPGAG